MVVTGWGSWRALPDQDEDARDHQPFRHHTFTTIVVTLAAVPFIQSVVASLGNTAAEGMQRGSRRAVQRLVSQRRQAALTAVPHAPRPTVIFQLIREGTDIEVHLPPGEDEATAAALLPQLDFEVFGESKTVVYWLDGTWMAAAALPHQRRSACAGASSTAGGNPCIRAPTFPSGPTATTTALIQRSNQRAAAGRSASIVLRDVTGRWLNDAEGSMKMSVGNS